jgi:hypothetical protein
MKKGILGFYVAIFCLTQQVQAQEPVEVKIYRSQLVELRGKVKAMTERVEREGRIEGNEQARSDTNKEIFALQRERARLDTRREIVALIKLNASITKEVSEANLKVIQRGGNLNKDLLLIAEASSVLGVVLDSLDNYVATQDRAFLGIAKDSEKLLLSIEKLF